MTGRGIKISCAAAILTGMALLLSCKKPKSPDQEETPFDKQGMLTSMADKLIIPCYADFGASLDSLKLAAFGFISLPFPGNLEKMRQRFDASYVLYQRMSVFGFGPGEDEAVRVQTNVFPADTVKINSNVSSGSYDLSAASNIAAKGMPALDFLLYGPGSDSRLVAQSRMSYVMNLISDMQARTSRVLNAWRGSYRSSFVNSLGADVGSSLGNLVNQLNYEIDYLKNAKVATPLGLKSDGIPKPDNSESFYGRRCNRLMMETFNAIENVYYGRSYSGSNGPGLDDYLIHLDLQYNGGQLHTAIGNQFNLTRDRLNAITVEMPLAVTQQKENVNAAYREIVKLLVLMKTDMPSGLGIVITYQDGDGD